jgi:hemoglobin
MAMTLYEKLGGQGAIRATVTKMYEKILGDDRVSYFFADTDMDMLRRMNSEFVGMAFGAPHSYTGQSLQTAHAGLVAKGLNDTHFDIVAEHLAAAMRELEVAPELIDEGLAIVESVRGDVLGK